MPCYHGQILDCDFFQHKKVVKYLHIVKRSPSLNASQLVKLKETIEQILDDLPEVEQPVRVATLQDDIAAENQRHRAVLHKIAKDAQNGKYKK